MKKANMNSTALGALAAVALLGGSAVALADGDHRNHGRHAQGTTAPNAQTPPTHQHSEKMGQRMAEMHARMHDRMHERHGTPQAGTTEPRSGQAQQGHGHSHDQSQSGGHGQGH